MTGNTRRAGGTGLGLPVAPGDHGGDGDGREQERQVADRQVEQAHRSRPGTFRSLGRADPGVQPVRLGAWFLAEAHGLDARVRAAERPEGFSPAPMRLFHLSISYLTLLFAAVAVTALVPWGHW